MQYDAAGNVTKIIDGVNSETVDYTYDDLDRLLTASVPTGESFAYDTIGNMTSKAGTSLDYGTTAPKHAVKSHGTTTYTYDANGSLTAKGTQTIKYDPERRPILVQDGTSFHRAAYDGDGVRRKRDDDNGIVHYLGAYERKLAGGANSSDTVTKYYSASLGAMSRPVAFRRSGTLHWVGSDHLGGTIRVLDSSFTALDGMRYKPYGEDRDTGSALVTDRKFTGQTEDEAAGLYWYASRAYDPAIGRFVSPDPFVSEPGNPQSLNRFSYVYNNPLKYTDPTGHYNVEDDKAWFEEFSRKNNEQSPTASDIAYRQASMDAALRGDDFSIEYWTGKIERAASNAAGSVRRAVSNAADSVGRTASNIADSVGGALLDAVVLRSQVEAMGNTQLPGLVQRLDYYEWNAVVHAYWSGVLTIVHGPAMAEEITERHERWGMERGQSERELAMDRYNNQVGRDIALGLPLRQRKDGGSRYAGIALLDKVFEAEREGILMKIVGEELKPTSPVNDVLPLDVIASPNQFHQR